MRFGFFAEQAADDEGHPLTAYGISAEYKNGKKFYGDLTFKREQIVTLTEMLNKFNPEESQIPYIIEDFIAEISSFK